MAENQTLVQVDDAGHHLVQALVQVMLDLRILCLFLFIVLLIARVAFLLVKKIDELLFVYHKHRHFEKDLLVPSFEVWGATKPLFFNFWIFNQS